MRSHLGILSAAILFIALMPILRSDDFFDLYYDMTIAEQALTPERQQLIWNQQVSPHQAAVWLRTARGFTPHSQSFIPLLHELYYRLGQLTHSRNARWTPETMNVCNNLMAALALFRTAGTMKAAPGSIAIIAGLPGVPENILTPLPEPAEKALWTVKTNTTVQLPIVILPLRAIRGNVMINCSSAQAANGSGELACKLYAVHYRLEDGKWQHTLTPDLSNKLSCRMQVILLQFTIPGNTPRGIYNGNVSLINIENGESSQLQYQLNVQAAGTL